MSTPINGTSAHASSIDKPDGTPLLIQPFGYLLVIDPECQEVVQCSANAHELFDETIEEIIGSRIDLLFNFQLLEDLHQHVFSENRLQSHTFHTSIKGREYVLSSQMSDAHLVLLIEPESKREQRFAHLDYADAVEDLVLDIDSYTDWTPMLEKAMLLIKNMTGFNRVMLLRFDDDFNAEVVSEIANPGLQLYQSHHFPASQFPHHLKELYLQRSTTGVWDARAEPVPVLPEVRSTDGKTPRLRQSYLHSLPHFQINHLQDMNLRSCFNISLVVHQRLWGIIACYHTEIPVRPDIYQRRACRFMGKILSGKIDTMLEHQLIERFNHNSDVIQEVAQGVKHGQDLHQLMKENATRVLEIFNADGYVLVFHGDTTASEKAPQKLPAQLQQKLKLQAGEIFESKSLLGDLGADFKKSPAGVLVLKMMDAKDMLVLYRYEHTHSIKWAGTAKVAPDQNTKVQEGFYSWVEEVKNQSQPWSKVESLLVEMLRNALFYPVTTK